VFGQPEISDILEILLFMIRSAIRELAGAEDSVLVTAAFNKSPIQIWNVDTRIQLGEIDAKFASGAKNLTIHPKGLYIATGRSSATSGTIALYETPGGSLLWERGRLKYPSHLRFSRSGESLYCTINSRTVETIDAKTGSRTRVRDGVRAFYEGISGTTLLVPTSGDFYFIGHNATNTQVGIPRLTFALLDVAFNADSIFVAESGGPVRCMKNSGNEIWRFDPPPGSHILKLHWSIKDRCCYGILHHYKTGAFRRLLRFQQDGREQCICDLNSWDELFVSKQNELLTSNGDIFDLADGRSVGKLAFPLIDYPEFPR